MLQKLPPPETISFFKLWTTVYGEGQRGLKWGHGRRSDVKASKIIKNDSIGTSNEGRRWLRKKNDFVLLLLNHRRKKNLKTPSWSQGTWYRF